MERIVLEIMIVLVIGILFISYYYQLFKGGKLAKMLLILEIGARTFSTMYVMIYGQFYSVWELLYYVPTILSMLLYYTQGIIAKIVLCILSVYVISSMGWVIYTLF